MSDFRRLPAPSTGVWQWQQHGACAGQGTGLFFHPAGERGPSREGRESAAKALCARCLVRPACRPHALAVGEPYGVWGGLSVADRAALVASEAPAGPAPRTPSGAQLSLMTVSPRGARR